MGNELNPKQEAFCHEYTVDFNATKAAERAGYSKKGSAVQGHQLLRNPKTIARLAELAKERCDSADINAQMVLDGIHAIAINPEAKHNDQLKAFELLGKYLKLFSDHKTIELPDNASFTMVVHGVDKG